MYIGLYTFIEELPVIKISMPDKNNLSMFETWTLLKLPVPDTPILLTKVLFPLMIWSPVV